MPLLRISDSRAQRQGIGSQAAAPGASQAAPGAHTRESMANQHPGDAGNGAQRIWARMPRQEAASMLAPDEASRQTSFSGNCALQRVEQSVDMADKKLKAGLQQLRRNIEEAID